MLLCILLHSRIRHPNQCAVVRRDRRLLPNRRRTVWIYVLHPVASVYHRGGLTRRSGTSRPSIKETMTPSEDNSLLKGLIGVAHSHDDDDHHHEEDDVHSVLVAKGVTMIILCAVSTCMGILPMLVARCLKWKTTDVGNPRSTKVVSLLLGFGGGVLFCTTFLHMLPEVKEGVEHLVEEKKLPDLPFSLAETFTCAGFFIMYLVEESVHKYLRKKQSQRDEFSKKDVSRSTNELVENGQSTIYADGHSHCNGHGHSHQLPIIADEKDDFVISSLRGLLIVLGLSVHELFEGLAIGLESTASYVWYMFAAVAAHKFVIAFCIGVELLASKTRTYLSVMYVCTFAIVSPLGIGIGMLLVGGDSADAHGILPVLLQGLASGTLLYVVFFEILQEHRTGLTQYLSILFGFAVMFALQVVTAHSHSHSHSHSHGHAHDHDDQHEDDHDHELDSYEYMHSNKTGEQMFTNTIDTVTESIAEAVSTVLSSSMATSTNASLRTRNVTALDS